MNTYRIHQGGDGAGGSGGDMEPEAEVRPAHYHQEDIMVSGLATLRVAGSVLLSSLLLLPWVGFCLCVCVCVCVCLGRMLPREGALFGTYIRMLFLSGYLALNLWL